MYLAAYPLQLPEIKRVIAHYYDKIYDHNNILKDRFGVQIDTQLAQDATTSTPEAYSSLLVLNAHTGSSTYTQNGNMRIDDSGDIFIYVE